jgi:hypothetical protein
LVSIARTTRRNGCLENASASCDPTAVTKGARQTSLSACCCIDNRPLYHASISTFVRGITRLLHTILRHRCPCSILRLSGDSVPRLQISICQDYEISIKSELYYRETYRASPLKLYCFDVFVPYVVTYYTTLAVMAKSTAILSFWLPVFFYILSHVAFSTGTSPTSLGVTKNLRHLAHKPRAGILSNSTSSINGTDDDPATIVELALRSLAKRNAARVENPKFNKLEFRQYGDVSPSLAPPLDYADGSVNSTSLRPKRSVLRRRNETLEETRMGYTIPPELAEAARIIAEATPQEPKGNHSEVAAAIRAKYAPNISDTNVPVPAASQFSNGTVAGSSFSSSTAPIQKRASGYWMVDLPQRGISPYGPSGYKVAPAVPTCTRVRLTFVTIRSGGM